MYVALSGSPKANVKSTWALPSAWEWVWISTESSVHRDVKSPDQVTQNCILSVVWYDWYIVWVTVSSHYSDWKFKEKNKWIVYLILIKWPLKCFETDFLSTWKKKTTKKHFHDFLWHFTFYILHKCHLQNLQVQHWHIMHSSSLRYSAELLFHTFCISSYCCYWLVETFSQTISSLLAKWAFNKTQMPMQ